MTFADDVGPEKFEAIVADFFAHHYSDRGMVKWQGYFLSDHTAALDKATQRSGMAFPPLSLQDHAYVRAILAQAFANHQSVDVQLDLETPDHQMFPPITGKVLGLTAADTVMIGDQQIDIRLIRHIELIPFPTR